MSLPAPNPASFRLWKWAYGAVVLLVMTLVAWKWDPVTGFTPLLRFGEPWHERRLEKLQSLPIAKAAGSSGYDGQFYAQLAVDPFLRAPELERALDAPAYRARRILLPWIAAALGFGDPWRTLQVFAWLNVVAWCAVAWLLRREIVEDSAVGFARWSGGVLALGALDSVRQSLVDLPALALMLGAMAAMRAGKAKQVTFTWPLAVLAKETTFLAAIAAHAWPASRGGSGWRRALGVLALAGLPFGLWLCFVAARFGRWSETGLDGNFGWPGVGLGAQAFAWATQLAEGAWSDRAVFGLLGVLGFLIQVLVLLRRWQPESAWWRIGVAHGALMLVLGVWVWSGYWAAARALLPLTVAFNLLLPGDRKFWPLWTLGNLSLLHGVIRFL